jgi:hypothetical protein
MNLPDFTQSVLERFDEQFGTIRHRGFPQNAIKSFITSILKERDESIRKAVEAMDFNHGYSVKKRVLALLREKQ